MSYTRIWIHSVWATRARRKTLTADVRNHLFEHIQLNALDKGLQLDSVGGHLEHVHCLLQLNATQSISDTIQLIKGESSRWFNLSGLSKNKLSWQSDYFAVSVSESMVDAVRAYISRQEAHHMRITFQEEYDEFMKKYGFGG